MLAAAFVGPALLTAAPQAAAAKWSVDAGVGSDVTWTSNAGLGGTSTGGSVATTAEGGGGDQIVTVRPHIRLLAEGERLKLSGSAALSAVTYLNSRQPSRLEPEADLAASLTAVERFLFVDAGLRARQSNANIFGARPETGTTTSNSVTSTQASIAPRIEGVAPNQWRYRVLSENSWTHESGATDPAPGADTGGGYFGRHSLSLEQDPKPFGWRVEAERTQSRFGGSQPDSVVTDLARATLDYAIGAELVVGVHAGLERTNIINDNQSSSLFGVDLKWRPSPRTLLSVFEERRFFGTSWKLGFDHRTPQFALALVTSRTLQSSTQSLLDLPATENVAALLDAIFTTRYPDPVARAQVVDNLIAQQGLPTSTLQPISLLAQRLSVVTLSSATATFIGRRNSLSLTAFQTRTEDAPDTGILASGGALTNNVQFGGSVALSHRLTPLVALIGSADWSRIRALESLGEQSTQRALRVRVNFALLPKTNAYVGGRVLDFASNVATSGREFAAFVGVDHRF